jgi:hypothetical protein
MANTLANNALCTLNEAKIYLMGTDSLSDTSKDDLFTRLINAASAAIEKYCDNIFIQREITEVFDGEGQTKVILRYYPLVSVNTVKEDGVVIDDYKAYSAGYIRFKHGLSSADFQNIEITYVVGRGTHIKDAQGNITAVNIDEDLKQACLLLVQYYYKTDIANFSTAFGEGGTVFRPSAMPPHVKVLLAPYVKVKA